MMAPSHYDIAFVALAVFYACAFAAGAGWLLARLKQRRRIMQLEGDKCAAPLSALQCKILILARNIRAFLQDLEVSPELRNPGPIKAGEDIATEMAKRTADTNAWHVANAEWARKRLYGYQARYLETVKRVANEIGAASGIVVAPLFPFIADVKPNIDFDALPDLLAGFVAELEKPEERRRLEAERKMQENLALATDNSNKLARIESPQDLRYRALAVIGGLYAFLMENGHDPCRAPLYNDAGLDTRPDEPQIKSKFPDRFGGHLKVIEAAADRLGFWDAISFSFARSSESFSKLNGDVNNADDVRSLIEALHDLARAIDSRHKREVSQ